MLEFKIKRTSGKTWANVTNEDFMTEEFLKKIGELLVESIVYEAGKDFAKQGNKPTPRGAPEGIPRSTKFFDSFHYRILRGQVEIYSTWPFIDQIIEGRKAYPMEWLTQQEGVSRVPMKQPDGTVLIRSTPATSGSAWIHPGFQKHNFVRRGYEKARQKMDQMVADQVVKILQSLPLA